MQSYFDKIYDYVMEHGVLTKGTCYDIHTANLRVYTVIVYKTYLSKHLEVCRNKKIILLVETIFDTVSSGCNLDVIADLAKLC